ncbi:hypothetical protein TSUD_103900 [Trifolium subterraneum]|uniref:Seed biotin-containing protein SBP65 n=1 Tax=Trifolium subterraneum TaxID=3900 RepID=A0A2Z6M4J3_TRISU|nr:hypothetical protein TSUD_103900 [Trifolium subterraneum]
MASEQLFRRENKTNERDVQVEKDRVPKMTTHFEHLSVTEQKPPQGSIDALQGGEINKDHAGKAIGDIGVIGKARETHELGSNFQSLSDKKQKQSERDHHHAASTNVAGGKSRESHELGSNFQSLSDRNRNESYRDHAYVPVTANLAGNRVGEKEGGRAIGDIGGIGKAREAHELGSNFQSLPDRNENQSYLDRARGPANANLAGNRAENRVGAKEDFGAVRDVGKFQMESIGGNKGLSDDREKLDTRTRVVTGTPQIKETNRGIGTGGRVIGAAENQGATWGKNAERETEEDKGRVKLGETRGRKIGAEDELSNLEKSAEEQRQKAREEEEKRSTLEEITKYRNQAQQSAMDAISAAQERAAQAKDVTKDTVSNATKTAADYAYPAAEKAKSAALQAKDVTVETGLTAAEKAKSAALQAKDVTVETGVTAAEKAKSAAEVAGKVAVDLKDKATVAGWTAAHYSTKLAVDGTKAAANAVEGAAGYVAPKAAELASKSVDVVKGLASSAGETAKEFTAKKKDESWREYEAKRVSGQLQEGEEIRPTSGQNVSNYTTQNVIPSEGRTQPQGTTNYQEKGRGSNVISSIGETVGNVGEKVGETMSNVGDKVKQPFTSSNSGQVQGKGSDDLIKNKPLGGSDVLGAVTETVSDIGSNIIKSTENTASKVKNTVTQEAQSGGVLDAIGETIAEIAHTTKAMVVGEDEEVVEEIGKKNIGLETHSIDRAKHDGHQASRNVF